MLTKKHYEELARIIYQSLDCGDASEVIDIVEQLSKRNQSSGVQAPLYWPQ